MGGKNLELPVILLATEGGAIVCFNLKKLALLTIIIPVIAGLSITISQKHVMMAKMIFSSAERRNGLHATLYLGTKITELSSPISASFILTLACVLQLYYLQKMALSSLSA